MEEGEMEGYMEFMEEGEVEVRESSIELMPGIVSRRETIQVLVGDNRG
jgi:hypothetical protein